MKFALCFVAVLGAAVAFPQVPPQENIDIDWSKIVSKDIYIDDNGEVKHESRVIGGTEAARNSIPWQAGLIIDGSSFCGGSLISRNYVLTAAHCTSGARSILVILGAHNIQQTESTQQRINSGKIITHSGYSASTISNDIALIKLSTPATLNSAVQTVPLAKSGSGTWANQASVLSGWGRTSDSSSSISSVLMRVGLTTITNSVCQSTFGSSVRSTNICTSGSGPKGGCNGDSGGPLTVSGTQVGIVSFGSSTCASGRPTVFTRVSEYQSWIAANSDVSF
ncbi:brachyurin-like [Aethina tumida]|uniref:brachyurin-like n=1 Tax=Aethina tumida TaxID=116153 RepID=UPI002147BAE5|nr:brachyurin-like [Aethina tumida]